MIKVNITMQDGTELKDVSLFESKDLGNSEIRSKEKVRLILNGRDPSLKNIYICGKYVQGGIIPQQVANYEIIDDKKKIRQSLLGFIREKNTIYDLNYSDVADFMLDNREELLRMLK